MILAMLVVSARYLRRRWLAAAVVAACGLAAAGPARAQGVEGGYLPSGGGTFVPFRGGPAGGLGVMPSGPRSPGPSASAGFSATMGGMGGPRLGAPAGLAPPRPIGVMGGMGRGGLIDRGPRGSGMGRAMPRPPVGAYPFRVPPDLRGRSTAAPAMAM